MIDVQNGVDYFKSHNIFDNNHLEVCIFYLKSKRQRVKLGLCADASGSKWNQRLAGHNGVRLPNILYQCRKSLKLARTVLLKHLKSTDMHDSSLDTESKKN